MELAPAVETRRERATAMARLRTAFAVFFSGLLRLSALTLLILPILVFSFLTVDMPVQVFDHLFNAPARPGAWLSRGDVAMTLVALVGVLIARRFGGDEAGRAITAAWGLAALGAFAGVAYLAPQLENGDLPTGRYVAGFVASAMMGQFIAIGLYDVLRGGTSWWRAPLYALLGGYAVSSATLFPVVYWGSGAPWTYWMATDLALKALIAVAFLVPYRLAMRRLRPRGGLGG